MVTYTSRLTLFVEKDQLSPPSGCLSWLFPLPGTPSWLRGHLCKDTGTATPKHPTLSTALSHLIPCPPSPPPWNSFHHLFAYSLSAGTSALPEGRSLSLSVTVVTWGLRQQAPSTQQVPGKQVENGGRNSIVLRLSRLHLVIHSSWPRVCPGHAPSARPCTRVNKPKTLPWGS